MTDVGTYASELIRMVAEDRFDSPEEFTAVHSWTDLHGICDANEYLLAANEKFGLDFPEGGEAADKFNRFLNEAIALAEQVLFPGKEKVSV